MDTLKRGGGLLTITSAARRHVLLVVVLVVLGLLVAAGYDREVARRYTAVAKLLPRPVIGNPLAPGVEANGTQLLVAIQTEAGLVDTPTVAEIASHRLGRSVPGPQDSVSASVPANTQIIRIAYVSRSARAAKQGAQAYAEAFLRYRHDVANAAQQGTLDNLETQAESVSGALVRARAQAAKDSNPQSLAAQQVQLLSDRLATINASISSTQAQGTNAGVVVTDAALPAAANGPSLVVLLVVGGLGGLVVGLALAVWRDRRVDVVDSAVEHDIAGVPVLARLPRDAEAAGALAIGSSSDDVEQQEAYRRVRSGLVALAAPPRVVAVASLSPFGSSAPLVANLGMSLAEAGFGVTVVSADPAGIRVERLLSTRESPGLSDVLTARADLSDCLQEVRGVLVLPAGSDPMSARERFAGPGLSQLLATLRRGGDYVLMATAPTTSADCESVALSCDGVLLTITEGSTTHAETTAVLDRFGSLGISTIGVVSVPPDPSGLEPGQQSAEVAQPTEEASRRAVLTTRQPAHDAGADS